MSVIGTSVTTLAAPLLVLYLSNSPAQAGLVFTAVTLPTFIFGLPAGVFIDKWDRKKVMILCDIGRMFVMTIIPIAAFFGHLSVPLILLSLFVAGTLEVFFSVAQTAALLHVIDKEQLSSALAQNNGAQSTASVIGPSIGGVIYQLGKTIPFLFDSFSYAISVISLLFINVPFQKEKVESEKKFIHEIRDGLIFLWQEPIIRFTSFMTGCGAIAGIASNLVVILLAKHLGASVAEIGIIFSLGSVGGILGAVVAAKMQKLFSLRFIILSGRWIFALCFVAFFFASHFWILGLINFVYAFYSSPFGNALATYQISHVPDVLQGRVASASRLILYTGFVLGSALGGVVIQVTGLPITIGILSTLMISLATVATLNKDLKSVNKITVAI